MLLNDSQIKLLCGTNALIENSVFHHKELGAVEINKRYSYNYEQIFKCLKETFPDEGFIASQEKPSDFKLIKDGRMIVPFIDTNINTDSNGNKIPSYGLGSFSYDVRLARNFKVMNTSLHSKILNPVDCKIDLRKSNPTEGFWSDYDNVDYITIPPHGFALGTTIERLNVPNNIFITCMAKPTLARCGLMAHVTPIECGWSGYVTIELSNVTPYPIIVPSGIGIMALIFYKGDVPEKTYDQKNLLIKGKYQDQPQTPILGIN